MKDLEKYLDTIGEKGAMRRLEAIASMDLGKRSDAARLVIQKRLERKKIIDKGFSFEEAKLIADSRNNH